MDNYFTPRTCCPVCGSTKNEVLHKHRFAEADDDTVKGYDVSLCPVCGLVFANNIPAQSEFDRYYEQFNKYQDLELYSWHPIHQQVFDWVTKNVHKDAIIVDIGCGPGYVLRKLKQNGYKHLIGLDTSETNCRRMESEGITTLCGSVFNVRSDELKNADVVLCTGVLEHIVDLKGLMSFIGNAVSQNGRLLLQVPTLQNGLGGKFPFENFSTEHINYFSPATLLRLLEREGFEPVECAVDEMTIFSIFQWRHDDRIRDYITDSENAIEKMLKKVDPLIGTAKPVYVYGGGTLCRYLLASTRFARLNIRAIIDRNITLNGRHIAGIPVILPEQLIENLTIIICSYFSSSAIERYIRDEIKLKCDIISLI